SPSATPPSPNKPSPLSGGTNHDEPQKRAERKGNQGRESTARIPPAFRVFLFAFFASFRARPPSGQHRQYLWSNRFRPVGPDAGAGGGASVGEFHGEPVQPDRTWAGAGDGAVCARYGGDSRVSGTTRAGSGYHGGWRGEGSVCREASCGHWRAYPADG